MIHSIDRPVLVLSRVSLAIHQLNRRAERNTGLSLTQWCLLHHLIELPAVSARTLARAVGVHSSTLSQSLKRLERKLLLRAVQDPSDSRRKLISITRAGRDALTAAAPAVADIERDLRDVHRDMKHVLGALDNRSLDDAVGAQK